MKKIILRNFILSSSLVALFLSIFFTRISFAQGMYGFQAGIGYGTAYKANITPALEGYYLKKITTRFYIGGSIFLQKYSFQNTLIKDTSNLNYGDILSISQRSAYLFFCPKFDFGFGYHKYIHATLSFGPGLYMGGNQYTYQFQPFWTTPTGSSYGADTIATNTSYNVPRIIYRVGVGISERIPTFRYWNILLTQELSYIPGYVSRSNADMASPNLSTSYISFTVGIMHKYPQVLVEY